MSTPIWVPNTAITVPVNLRYLDGNGDPVTSLYPLDYLTLVGQDLNMSMSNIDVLEAATSGNTAQIAILTAAVSTIPPEYTTPTIPTQCLTPSGSTMLPIDQVLNTLVTDWCSYINITGGETDLAESITTQCQNLNSSPSFGTPGTSMSAITGWRTTPTTVADTLANLWYTTCDARAGIQSALDALTPSCSQIIINYQAVLTNSGTVFDLFFNGYTFIPDGYVDLDSTLKITDTEGNVYIQTINLVTVSNTPGAYQIALSGTTLLANDTYTFTLTSQLYNATLGQTCIKTGIQTVWGDPAQPDPGSTICCPAIGNYSAVVASGATAVPIVSGLPFTPRFVTWVHKDSTSVGTLPGAATYITYVSGGAVVNALAPLFGGTVNIDYIAYR